MVDSLQHCQFLSTEGESPHNTDRFEDNPQSMQVYSSSMWKLPEPGNTISRATLPANNKPTPTALLLSTASAAFKALQGKFLQTSPLCSFVVLLYSGEHSMLDVFCASLFVKTL